MKNLIFTGFTAVLIVFLMPWTAAKAAAKYPVHILPDERISDSVEVSFLVSDDPRSNYVTEAMRVGKKNMDWLKHMNSLRPDDQKIALTKPGELHSYPITKPNTYSPKSIEADFKTISSEIPQNMRDIIFGNSNFSDDPGIDLPTYILWAKKVDKLYQTATRWSLLSPYLWQYTQNKRSDIRGYYFLTREENLEGKLRDFASLSTEESQRLTPLLVNLCENTSGDTAGCTRELTRAASSGQVVSYYNKYYKNAKNAFDENFEILAVRSDLVWTSSNPNLAVIPVRDTQKADINNFLKYNIEDEWKWNNWHLSLFLTPDADVHVEFEAGQTPHVNGLGGNTITMDANAPLTEWDVQWTIRHEFGHVLGFPDCYVEFYDQNLEAMVNYQIDTTNMMCSRAGKMQEVHYTEMKRAYFH